jgi:UPF0716 protein FxsA
LTVNKTGFQQAKELFEVRIPLIIFIVIPIAELLLLFEVADWIGGVPTLLLVIVTAFVGLSVLKRQGFSTLTRANVRLRDGQLPAQEIIEGMMLAFAGALLLTPGFITDTIGFTLLTPRFRQRIAAKVLRSGKGLFFGGIGGRFMAGSPYTRDRSRSDDGDVVEGDYTDENKPRLDDNEKQ